MKKIKMLVTTTFVCLVMFWLFSCVEPIYQKDLVGDWICVGFSEDKDISIFMGITFNDDNTITIESSDKVLNGKYNIEGKNIICKIDNVEESSCVLTVHQFNSYKMEDMKDVADNTMVMSMYLDNELYMQFDCFRIKNNQ